MATKMKYRVVPNNTPTKDRAPYVGQVTPAYEVDFEDFVKGLVAEASPADADMVFFFFAALYEFVMEDMPANLNRYNLGAFTIEAKINGSFPSEDAEFDPARNEIVVGATLSQEIRDAVGEIVPSRDADAVATDVRLNTVMDIASQVYSVIDGTGEFRLAGRKLFVSDGAGYVRVKDSDGVATDCTVTRTEEDGQRVYARLPAALPAGSYTLEVASNGGDAANPTAVITRKVKVLAPPGPILEGVSSESGEGSVRTAGAFTVTGKRLAKLDGDTLVFHHLYTTDDGQELSDDYDLEEWSSTDTTLSAICPSLMRYNEDRARIALKRGGKEYTIDCDIEFV